ncbi:MAG: Zn-ribbon domain-containing OB-fold protein, partial [Halobacteriales archaeon]
LGVDGLDVDAAAVQAADGAQAYRVADDIGLDAGAIRRGSTAHDLGDAGAAGALLGLARALADGAARVLVVGQGGGAGADALLVEGGDVPTSTALDGDVELSYAEALRRRGTIARTDRPEGGGASVSMPTWRASLAQRHRLEAGRCRACGAMAIPPEGACPACDAVAGFEPVGLPGTGTVEAVTTIAGGEPPEFVPQRSRGGPFDVAIVSLDGPDGDRVSVPLQVAGEAVDVEIGDDVTTAIRHLYDQAGVPRYARKAIPVG